MADGYGARIFCARVEDLAAGAGDQVTLDLVAIRQTVRDRLAVTARASTASKDGQAANDEDFAEVKTVGRPRWTRGF